MLLPINGSSPDPATPIVRNVTGTSDTLGIIFLNPDDVVGISQSTPTSTTQIQLRFSPAVISCFCCPILLQAYITSHQTKQPPRS